MSLREKIDAEIKAAMKSKDKVRLETVRSIKKVLLEKESSARGAGQETLTEDQELEVLMQGAKQRRDAIEQYQKAGREDLADKEAAELAIIEEYLPKQMSDEEISAFIDDILIKLGVTSPHEMGKVMGSVMQQLKGKADGKKIQELVKAKLNG
ncbi:MAG: GatB/YqeY domain-containing protein [Microcoleaceae cyanobacterium]|jgi:uncharacterized protein YqeY